MTIAYIPDPYTTDFDRWANEIIRQDAVFPRHNGEQDWKQWASDMILLAGLDVASMPNPFEIDSWQEWGAQLRKVIGA